MPPPVSLRRHAFTISAATLTPYFAADIFSLHARSRRARADAASGSMLRAMPHARYARYAGEAAKRAID